MARNSKRALIVPLVCAAFAGMAARAAGPAPARCAVEAVHDELGVWLGEWWWRSR